MNKTLTQSQVYSVQIKQLLNYCIFIVKDNPYTTKLPKTLDETYIELNEKVDVKDEKQHNYRIIAKTYFKPTGVIPIFRERNIEPLDIKYDNYRLMTAEHIARLGSWSLEVPRVSAYYSKGLANDIAKTVSSDKAQVRKKQNKLIENIGNKSLSDELTHLTNEINAIIEWYNFNNSAIHIFISNQISSIPQLLTTPSPTSVKYYHKYLNGLFQRNLSFRWNKSYCFPFDKRNLQLALYEVFSNTIKENPNYILKETDVSGFLGIGLEPNNPDIIKLNQENIKRQITKYLTSNHKTRSPLENTIDTIIANYELMRGELPAIWKTINKTKLEICPHYKELVKLAMSLKPSKIGYDIDSILRYIADNWSTHEGDAESNHYYCKNCGVLLYKDFVQDVVASTQLSMKLSDMDPSWTLILRNVAQTIKYIKGTRNWRNLVENISELIQPTIDAVLSQLNRIKTLSMIDLKNIKILYIHIYIFAALARFAFVNKFKWNIKLTGMVKINEENKSKIAAYSLFMTNYGLSQSLITKQEVQNIFNKAYQLFSNLHFKFERDEPKESDKEEADIFYQFAKYPYMISGVKMPKTLLELKALPYSKAVCKRTIDEYNSYYEYRRNKIYTTSPTSVEFKAWYDKWGYLAPRYDDWKKDIHIIKMQLFGRMIARSYTQVSHAEVFCPDGNRHDFSLSRMLIRKKHSSAEGVRSRNFIPAGGYDSSKFDEICPRCGYINGTDAKLNEEELFDIKKFFSYVNIYCPIKEEHEFKIDSDGLVGNNPCKWCEYRHSYFIEQPSAFYKKWKKKIELDMKILQLQPQSKKIKGKSRIRLDIVTRATATNYKKWTTTTIPILEVCRLLSIDSNLFILIGALEKENYSEADKGIKRTLTNEEKLLQITNIRIYIKWLLIFLNTLKTGTNQTEELKKQIDTTDFSNLDIPYEDIDNQLAFQMSFEKIDLSVNFMQCALASLILYIKNISKTGTTIASYVFKKILACEKLGSLIILSKTEIKQTSVRFDTDEIDPESEYAEPEYKAKKDILSLEDVDIETSNIGAEDEYNEEDQ